MLNVTHSNQLENKSTWRVYQAGLKELELLEAPKSTVLAYKYGAARECFLAFASLMMDEKLKVVDFHEIIACCFEDLAKGHSQRLIVSCPPRSGKSLFAQLFVSWLIGRDEQTQHIVASYGQQLSNRFHRGIIGFLKHKAFSKIFPEWSGFEADSKYEMRGKGYILATSVGGVLTGFTAGSSSETSKGVGALVIDDPLKDSSSKAALSGLETWWGEAASTRRTNRWCQLVIATRFHEKDLHGLLMDSDGLWDAETNPNGWKWLNIPGLCENEATDPLGRKNGESHWPDNSVFTPEMLLSQKRAMGSNAFAALYQGTPTAQEGSIVKAGWVEVVEPEECPEFDVTYLSLDTAFSEKQSADESVICVAGFCRKKPDNIYIRELIHGRWGFPDLLAMLEQTQKYYGARFCTIEQAASGQSLIQVLERESKIQLHPFKPLRSKTIRLQTVCPLFEAKRVKFVDGGWVQDFIKELTSFPHVPHDDRTDAVVWALTYYLFHLDGGGAELTNAVRSSLGRNTGRRDLMKEFGEVKTGRRREMLTPGEREAFFGAGIGKRKGRQNIRYDTGLE